MERPRDAVRGVLLRRGARAEGAGDDRRGEVGGGVRRGRAWGGRRGRAWGGRRVDRRIPGVGGRKEGFEVAAVSHRGGSVLLLDLARAVLLAAL
eukprot:29232-Pelagococcus_subviridis.AAC.1